MTKTQRVGISINNKQTKLIGKNHMNIYNMGIQKL